MVKADLKTIKVPKKYHLFLKRTATNQETSIMKLVIELIKQQYPDDFQEALYGDKINQSVNLRPSYLRKHPKNDKVAAPTSESITGSAQDLPFDNKAV